MTREEVWRKVSDALRPDFGRLLDVRDVRRVRHVVGEAWSVTVVLASSARDMHAADVTVEDTGAMSPKLTAERVIQAVKRGVDAPRSTASVDELADFGEPED